MSTARPNIHHCMKRRTALLAGSLASAGFSASAGIVDWFTGVKLGMSLPVFDAEWLTEAPSDHRRLLLVDFWATWCAPCRNEFPHLNELSDAFASAGLQVAGLSLEPKEIVQPFLAKVDIRYRVGAGGKRPLQQSLGVKALPYSIAVDNANKVVWRGQSSELAEAEVERLLKGAA